MTTQVPYELLVRIAKLENQVEELKKFNPNHDQVGRFSSGSGGGGGGKITPTISRQGAGKPLPDGRHTVNRNALLNLSDTALMNAKVTLGSGTEVKNIKRLPERGKSLKQTKKFTGEDHNGEPRDFNWAAVGSVVLGDM